MPNSRRSFCTGNKKPIVTPLTGRECCCNTCTNSHVLQWQMVASNAAHWPSSKDAQLTHSCHRHQPCSSWTSRHDWANCQLNADRLPPSVPTQPWPQDLLLLVSTSVLMSASVTDGYDSCWPAPSEGGVKIPLTTVLPHDLWPAPRWPAACQWCVLSDCPSPRCQWSMTGSPPASLCPCRMPQLVHAAEQSAAPLQCQAQSVSYACRVQHWLVFKTCQLTSVLHTECTNVFCDSSLFQTNRKLSKPFRFQALFQDTGNKNGIL